MTRFEAEDKLKRLFGFHHFFDLQWQVIDYLLSGKRVLFIEKTGFGKSLCYQFPATQLDGVTIVFSPLIALMRDQVRSMLGKGIRAASINYNQTSEENAKVIEQAQNNQLDILYIAPERMENAEWIVAASDMKIGMVVIDEAHCISIWGQSFRPDYRRIVNLVKMLPNNFPVLATTATATKHVQADIIEQVGDYLIPVRGNLLRSNIGLYVIQVQSEDEKFYWLAEHLPKMPKTGIIYTGTISNTDIYSNWVQYLGLKSAAYNGRLDSESRKRVEEVFISNGYDCVVSTNALGMGIDKPDIRFIIHTQIPESPIYYYQEIGRSGRDGEKAYAILFYNPNKDKELPLKFIEGSKPSREKYESVLSVTKKALLGKNEIIKATNLKQTYVSVVLADLIDQGIINELQGKCKKYFYNPDAPPLNFSLFEMLRKTQLEELEKMIEYTRIQSCRMQFLCNYLGDEAKSTCGICDNDKNSFFKIPDKEEIKEKLRNFRETFFPVLEVETRLSNIINGVAASYYGTSNVGAAIHHSKYDRGGDFPDWLLTLTLKAYRKHFNGIEFDLIIYVPPTESGELVKHFAEKVSKGLNVPLSYNLKKRAPTEPQKIFQSSISKKDNVKDIFLYENSEEIIGKKVLLIDDIFDSGCTIKEIGKYLTKIGVEVIAPLVIAKTVVGDI